MYELYRILTWTTDRSCEVNLNYRNLSRKVKLGFEKELDWARSFQWLGTGACWATRPHVGSEENFIQI